MCTRVHWLHSMRRIVERPHSHSPIYLNEKCCLSLSTLYALPLCGTRTHTLPSRLEFEACGIIQLPATWIWMRRPRAQQRMVFAQRYAPLWLWQRQIALMKFHGFAVLIGLCNLVVYLVNPKLYRERFRLHLLPAIRTHLCVCVFLSHSVGSMLGQWSAAAVTVTLTFGGVTENTEIERRERDHGI